MLQFIEGKRKTNSSVCMYLTRAVNCSGVSLNAIRIDPSKLDPKSINRSDSSDPHIESETDNKWI